LTGDPFLRAPVGLASPDEDIAGRMSLTLAVAASSCREARGAVRAFCVDNSHGSLADDAELLTSEIVANAVEHSVGSIRVTATATRTWITVSVADDSSSPIPTAGRFPHELAERGRGLLVVEELAGDWGTTPNDSGKSIWFRLP